MTLRFDAEYYRRFYEDPATRVYDRRRHQKLVAGVVHLVEWFGVSLDEVLDVGAGLGWWGQWLAKHRPGAKVLSTELEPEICKRYGHQQADLRTFRLERTFDLVVCQGVLPYLDSVGASLAIDNLGAMCGGFLYLEAITKDDLADAVDAARTDLRVELRPAAWYRKRLSKHFKEVGGGLYLSRSTYVPLFALEAAPSVPGRTKTRRKVA